MGTAGIAGHTRLKSATRILMRPPILGGFFRFRPIFMETANFDAELTAATGAGNDLVIRTGLVFKAGDYPDKKFSLTPDELRAAAVAFTPCAADLEHKQTVLDGKLGQLLSVTPSEDGQSLFGVVAEPKWLNDVLGNAPRKVSLAWDQATKRITHISHVLNPRIPEAAVFSAYAQFSKSEEQNMTTEAAATPQEQKPNRFAQFMAWLNGEANENPVAAQFAVVADPTPQAQQAQAALGMTTMVGATGSHLVDPEKEALKAQIAQFTADQEKQRLAGIRTTAIAEADKLVEAGIIEAKGNQAYIETVAVFSIAGEVDSTLSELACFSADAPAPKDFSLTKYLAEVTGKLPQHGHAGGEQVNNLDTAGIALFGQEKTTETDRKTGKVSEVSEAVAKRAFSRPDKPAKAKKAE